jgi:hypothetical protein
LSNTIQSVPKAFYLFAVAAIAIIFEKIAIVILNKESRTAIKQRWIAFYTNCLLSSTHISPLPPPNNTNRAPIRKISKMTQIVIAPKTQQKESNSL